MGSGQWAVLRYRYRDRYRCRSSAAVGRRSLVLNNTAHVDLVDDQRQFTGVDLGAAAGQPGGEAFRVKFGPAGQRAFEEVEHVVQEIGLVVGIVTLSLIHI